MNRLKQEVEVLRRLFDPEAQKPNGTVMWEPLDNDPHAQFKKDLLDKAGSVLIAGDRSLSGSTYTAPEFGDSEFDAVEQTLSSDPSDSDDRAYFELAAACEAVVQSLRRLAA